MKGQAMAESEPKQFPLTLEDALGYWLPGVKPTDREPIYRRWLDDCNAINAKFPSTLLPAPHFTIKGDKAKLLSAVDFHLLGGGLCTWYLHNVRSKAGKEGGRGHKKPDKRKVKKKSC